MPIEGAVLFKLLPVKEVCTKGSNSHLFSSFHFYQYQNTSLKNLEVYIVYNTSFPMYLKAVHIPQQVSLCILYGAIVHKRTLNSFLIFFTGLEHFPHGYFTGPGFRAISPDSIKSLISDD